ncbi:MAG TPA: redoxin domain-containing protein [Calditrichia bacterium]|nr:redoxin domain-containing protein [Calditrichia bacterium]
MAQLRQDYQDFEARDITIVVLGPESPESFARFWERESLPFAGLPDPRHQVLDLYGQEVSLFKLGRMPAQVLVDRDGLVRLAHYGNHMADIPASDDILKIADNPGI